LETSNRKTCIECGLELPATSEFFTRKTLSPDGLEYRCRKCNRKIHNKYYHDNVERILSQKREKTYGLSHDEYKQLLIKQGEVCAICGKPESLKIKGKTAMLSVDHNHYTGEIRGLLCSRCNRGLGVFNDDIELFKKAASYLEEVFGEV
jgi:hypothetical protein